MTQDDAQREILREWRAWCSSNGIKNARGHDGLIFFGHLQANKHELLRFRYSGDKWQRVHGGLLSAGLVSE